MISPLHKKLRIKPGQRMGIIHKIPAIEKALKPLPEGCTISRRCSDADDVIFWFVAHQAAMEEQVEEVLALLTDSNTIWIGHPKGTSGIQTDLTRDKGWDCLMSRNDISFTGYIAFDTIWSAFCIRKKKAADAKKESKKEERLIFQYADPKTKTVRLPPDFENILAKNKQARAIFEALSYSHRREYVEWIISAKKEETRHARLEKTIQKLISGFKNPSERN